MDYITSLQAAERWHITKRQVNSLCSMGRIPGAARQGNRWMIPSEYDYPGSKTAEKSSVYPSVREMMIRGNMLRESGDFYKVSCGGKTDPDVTDGESYDRKLCIGQEKTRTGKFINIGNEGFRSVRSSEYVDKSELIDFVNSCLNTSRKLICVSRPRRFGKSFAAKMLCAYYCRECDSEELFRDLKIAEKENWRENLNRYDVLYLDITLFLSTMTADETLIDRIEEMIIEDLEEYSRVRLGERKLVDALRRWNAWTGRKIVLILDEWDAIFRECRGNEGIQNRYILLLRSLFKSSLTDRIFAGVYMTGILPIKKYGHESAVSDFYEYSMIDPYPLQNSIGFSADEVQALCAEHSLDYREMKRWYDGYHVGDLELYNPKSVMEAIFRGKFSNYWTKTETYESLRDYIDMNFDGLKDSIVDMLGGGSCEIDSGSFQNDMTSLRSRDDVLTLLVHLGYLAYDETRRSVSVPNAEIREEFVRAIRNGSRKELMRAVQRSDAVLQATWNMDGDRAAALLEEIHDEDSAPDFYNNEQALRNVVKMAYLSGVDSYIRMEEIPAGRGYADMVFWPRAGVDRPALIVELKWNRSENKALQQIREKKYPALFRDFEGNVLLVGISYDTTSKSHSCRIEEYCHKNRN